MAEISPTIRQQFCQAGFAELGSSCEFVNRHPSIDRLNAMVCVFCFWRSKLFLAIHIKLVNCTALIVQKSVN